MRSRDRVDVLVIGAGPAGTIASSLINQAGISVRIIEKEKFPKFVIGESLLPSSMEHFQRAGVLEALKARNYQLKPGARFIKNGKSVYFDFSNQFTKGSTWTWQAPRADFDKTIADEVEKQGVEISYETTVMDLDFQETAVLTKIENKNGQTSLIESKFIIDASGYGRVLPRLLQLNTPSNLPSRQSYFTHVKEPNRPAGEESNLIGFEVLAQDLWFWSIPFSNGNTSIGFVGDPEHFLHKTGKKKHFKEMLGLLSHYSNRFENLEEDFEPRSIKAYSVSTRKFSGNRFVLVGNSTEFLDPVFSSGVALATESASKAAELVIKQFNGDKVNWETEYDDYMQEGINVFRSYVNSWYEGSLQTIFFTDKINETFQKQISSVLSGYVWDRNNPFVTQHERILKSLAKAIEVGM